jgi:hypothetical protein
MAKRSDEKEALARMLDEGVILQGGEGSVDLSDDDPVYVGLVMDVSGYGPHTASIYVEQNRYHGSRDSALQGAYEIHEEWMREHYADHLKELYEEALKEHNGDEDAAWQQADEYFREDMDGRAYAVSATDLWKIVQAGNKWAKRVLKYVSFSDSSGELNIKILPYRGK